MSEFFFFLVIIITSQLTKDNSKFRVGTAFRALRVERGLRVPFRNTSRPAAARPERKTKHSKGGRPYQEEGGLGKVRAANSSGDKAQRLQGADGIPWEYPRHQKNFSFRPGLQNRKGSNLEGTGSIQNHDGTDLQRGGSRVVRRSSEIAVIDRGRRKKNKRNQKKNPSARSQKTGKKVGSFSDSKERCKKGI